MPRIESRPIDRRKRESTWLLEFRQTVSSQLGQDGILEKIFEVMGITKGYCVEFGAWDGRYLSNTWRLIADKGWSGILLEGDADRCRQIELTHPYRRVKAVNQLVEFDGANAFDETMRRLAAPQDIDFVSIDIDGNDWHVWNSIQNYRAKVVLIEFNPTVPNDVLFVQDPSPTVNQGSSLLAMIELGKSKGYSLVCVEEWDAFFVEDRYAGFFGIDDNSIDAMFWSNSQMRIFQGYDGTLYTAGNLMLIWKNVKFARDTLQILPPNQRSLF